MAAKDTILLIVGCLVTFNTAFEDSCTFNNRCVHGTCEVFAAQPFCRCQPGFYGKFCNVHCEHLCHEQPNAECSPEIAEYPENKGECRCKDNFVPLDNPSTIYLRGCVKPNHPCVTNNPCHNGVCEDDGNGNALCSCPHSFYGSNCEYECERDICKYQLNTECISDGLTVSDKIARCRCKHGYVPAGNDDQIPQLGCVWKN